MAKEYLRQPQLLSEAGAAEALGQRVSPERAEGLAREEAPGVSERGLHANASVALRRASAVTTQAGLNRLCRAGRRLVQSRDPAIRIQVPEYL